MSQKTVIAVSLSILEARHNHMAGRVTYELGAKSPSLGCDTSRIRTIDCSGYTRDQIYAATGGKVIIPEGSQAQRDWCESQGLHRLAHYSDVAYAAQDASRLFIAFLSPHPGEEWPRHVWLIRSGTSRESCGSRGVCSRTWDNSNLVSSPACYELPTVA